AERHVARGEDTRVAGAQAIVDDNLAARADIDLGRTEVQLLGVRGATGGYEQRVTFHHLLDVADSDDKSLGGAALLRSHKRGACHDLHALALQNAADALRDLRVIPPQ